MSEKINRTVGKTVIDDVIENLQILSSKENAIKRNLALGIKLADAINLICPACLKPFSRPSGNILHKLKCGKTPCCSRRCGGIYSHDKKQLNRLIIKQ